MRKRVILESPYRGEVAKNKEYAYRCLQDSVRRGEAPFAGHLLYTQVLNDDIEDERYAGIQCSFVWLDCADLHVFYIDRGWSDGMLEALARTECDHIQFRSLESGIVKEIKR